MPRLDSSWCTFLDSALCAGVVSVGVTLEAAGRRRALGLVAKADAPPVPVELLPRDDSC